MSRRRRGDHPEDEDEDEGEDGEAEGGEARGRGAADEVAEDGTLPAARPPERAVLAAGLSPKDPRWAYEDPLGELAALSDTAGVEVAPERVVQRRERPDPATYVGKGRVEDIKRLVEAQAANVVIFDNDLSPGQRRNLEKAVGKKVIDRTELILDIFARHARTPQARLQVEIAQLEYQLPRLRRLWTHLDPGVGLRNPGEKQLELDKRLIRIRIQELKKDLERVRSRKERQLEARADVFTVAIVGYTNAGKSTLMNRLTDAGVYVANQLFATLDTRTRQWEVGPKRVVLLSDTVGFVRHLPHHLVESFHATLEEVVQADLLLHVVDASDPEPLNQVEAVREVLAQIGIQDKPELMVLNKVDRVAQPELLPYLERRLGNPVRISALTGEGIDELRARVNEHASAEERLYALAIDVREGAAIAAIERSAEVRDKRLEDEVLHYLVRCRVKALAAVRRQLRRPDALQVEEQARPARAAPAPDPEARAPGA